MMLTVGRIIGRRRSLFPCPSSAAPLLGMAAPHHRRRSRDGAVPRRLDDERSNRTRSRHRCRRSPRTDAVRARRRTRAEATRRTSRDCTADIAVCMIESPDEAAATHTARDADRKALVRRRRVTGITLVVGTLLLGATLRVASTGRPGSPFSGCWSRQRGSSVRNSPGRSECGPRPRSRSVEWYWRRAQLRSCPT